MRRGKLPSIVRQIRELQDPTTVLDSAACQPIFVIEGESTGVQRVSGLLTTRANIRRRNISSRLVVPFFGYRFKLHGNQLEILQRAIAPPPRREGQPGGLVYKSLETHGRRFPEVKRYIVYSGVWASLQALPLWPKPAPIPNSAQDTRHPPWF